MLPAFRMRAHVLTAMFCACAFGENGRTLLEGPEVRNIVDRPFLRHLGRDFKVPILDSQWPIEERAAARSHPFVREAA